MGQTAFKEEIVTPASESNQAIQRVGTARQGHTASCSHPRTWLLGRGVHPQNLRRTSSGGPLGLRAAVASFFALSHPPPKALTLEVPFKKGPEESSLLLYVLPEEFKPVYFSCKGRPLLIESRMLFLANFLEKSLDVFKIFCTVLCFPVFDMLMHA